MQSSFRLTLIAVAASGFVLATVGAASAQTEAPPPWMQHWAADHEALLNAKIAGLKAGLKLTPDQEKLWGPFEAAVRDAAALRMLHMGDMMGRMSGGHDMNGPPPSPVDRLEMMADHMSEGAAALKKIADTAKPLYASLDDQQKRIFGWLGREMMMLGYGPRHHRGMGPEEMDHEGMGPHEGGPHDMGMMGPHPHDSDMDTGDDSEQ